MYIAKIKEHLKLSALPLEMAKYSLVYAEIIYSNEDFTIGQKVACIDTLGVLDSQLVLLDKYAKSVIDNYTIDKEVIAIITKTKYFNEEKGYFNPEKTSDIKTVIAEQVLDTLFVQSPKKDEEVGVTKELIAGAVIDDIYNKSLFINKLPSSKDIVAEIFLADENRRWNKGEGK